MEWDSKRRSNGRSCSGTPSGLHLTLAKALSTRPQQHPKSCGLLTARYNLANTKERLLNIHCFMLGPYAVTTDKQAAVRSLGCVRSVLEVHKAAINHSAAALPRLLVRAPFFALVSPSSCCSCGNQVLIGAKVRR